MKRITFSLMIVAVVCIFTVGVFFAVEVDPSTAQAADNGVTVSIDNFTFMSSGPVTIPAGTTVTWVNHDDVPHTVVSTEQKFKSKALDTDEKFSFTFTQPGEYPYFCSIHPKMVAKVIVTAKK
jgi:plastocyanin